MARKPDPLRSLVNQLQPLVKNRKRKIPRLRKRAEGKGLTARQMIKATPSKIKENARHVRVRKVKKKKTSPFTLAITTTERKHATELQPHYQAVEIVSPGKERDLFDPRVRLKISCDCSHFKYRVEYALYRYGAADILYSNGKPADVTNPQNRPWLCKHWIAIFKFLQERRDNRLKIGDTG